MAVNPKKDALTSSDLAGAIPEDFVGAVNKNAKFAPGDVAYCRAFACNARVMSVGTTKSGICNYKVALYDAKGVPTGEAVCSESDLVRRSVRGLKLTGLASGASRACDVAATILEKMVQRNKVDLPLAKKVLRLTQRDFPDARVSVAAAKLNENPPALLSAAKILRAEANRLRAQGKSMKAMRAAVKRAPAEALPMIAPLHSKLLMVYRKFIGSPETASLGSLPALAAQWKAVGNKLPDEEQSGVALIVRDLISAYRSFTKEQTKNVAYFLAMALGTANKMVGGSANVPIPAHLRAVKASAQARTGLIMAHHPKYARTGLRVTPRNESFINELVQSGLMKIEGEFASLTPKGAREAERLIDSDPDAAAFYYRPMRSVKAFTAAEEALIKRGMSNVQKGDLDLRDAERERDGYIRHSVEVAKQSKRTTDPQRAAELMKQSDTLLRRAAIANEVIQRLKRQGMGYKPLRSVKADQTQVRAFHAASDELRDLTGKIHMLRADPIGGMKRDLLKGLWTKPKRANDILVGAGIKIPTYAQVTKQTIAAIDAIAERGSGNPKDPYGDLLLTTDYDPNLVQRFVSELMNITKHINALYGLLMDYRRFERNWPVASVKAIDAKEYYEKNKKIPIGSILRVNGKLVQVDRANGYVISGYEYKKPWSTNTHVAIDLRNSPATLISVGTGTFREGRNGNVVFGRRPAN